MIKAASLSFDVKLPAAEPELHQTKFLMQTAGWWLQAGGKHDTFSTTAL